MRAMNAKAGKKPELINSHRDIRSWAAEGYESLVPFIAQPVDDVAPVI